MCDEVKVLRAALATVTAQRDRVIGMCTGAQVGAVLYPDAGDTPPVMLWTLNPLGVLNVFDDPFVERPARRPRRPR